MQPLSSLSPSALVIALSQPYRNFKYPNCNPKTLATNARNLPPSCFLTITTSAPHMHIPERLEARHFAHSLRFALLSSTNGLSKNVSCGSEGLWLNGTRVALIHKIETGLTHKIDKSITTCANGKNRYAAVCSIAFQAAKQPICGLKSAHRLGAQT